MSIDDNNTRLGEIDAELETLAALVDPTEDDIKRSDDLTAEGAKIRADRERQ